MFDVVPTPPTGTPNDTTVAPSVSSQVPQAQPGTPTVPASNAPANVPPAGNPTQLAPTMTPATPAVAPQQAQPGATAPQAPAPTTPAPQPAQAPAGPTLEDRVAGIEFEKELTVMAPHLASEASAIWSLKKSFPGMTTQQAVAQHLGSALFSSAQQAQGQGITHQPVAPAFPSMQPNYASMTDADLEARARQELRDKGFV